MILESVENGPLLWPTIEENRVTRPNKYSKLSATEVNQADCDVKATNNILQGLPPEVYALVSNHKFVKELLERIQPLMQGTSLTKQERGCKLYDEFDKFVYKKGESLREFYLRFSLLLNDMNIYNMKMEQFQVNTKFLNTLPPEWSKFVTDVKLSSHYGSHAESSTPLLIIYPSNDFQSSVHHNVYNPSSSIPQVEYAPSVHQQFDFSQPNSSLIVPLFQKGDDPIDAINHMVLFLTTVVTSRYPPTNNQLRNSSNPRKQATINNGRVTVQSIQGRQNSLAIGTSKPYTSGPSGNNSGKQRIIVCYNCKGEGNMSKQCTKPKRKRDEAWFKDKVLLIALIVNLSHYGSDNLAEEDLVTHLKYFQDTFESSDDSTNVVNAPREPFVVKKDHGVNPPHIDKCCCECGEALDGIFCQQCTYKSCGKDAHIGYNCQPKVPIISNLKPCNQTMNDELPQTLPGFDPTCYSDKENSVPCVLKPNFVDESSNIFNPPPQPPIYSCEFCGSNAQYGHYCTPQAPFINPEPGYSQDFNFPQDIHDFQQ
nr:hypothetical protein [Tanacetum cinerariifolium]